MPAGSLHEHYLTAYEEGPLPTLDIPQADRYYRICDLAPPLCHRPDVGGDIEPLTPAEAAEISRYAWFSLAWYREGWRQKALENDLKMSGHNTVTFYKWPNGCWSYKRSSWTMGPWSVPLENGVATATLTEVIDLIESIIPDTWKAFCERHPLPEEG